MEEIVATILLYIGTVAFALSGGLKAIKHDFDYLGIIALACVTALGGGTIRDILLGRFPPDMFVRPVYATLACGTAVALIIVGRLYKKPIHQAFHTKLKWPFAITDAVGLGIFTVSGMNAAFELGNMSNPFLCVFVGLITGIGGGMLRDVFSRENPSVFREELYAVPSLIGGIAYYLLRYTEVIPASFAMMGVVAFIIIFRLLAVKRDWNLPKLAGDDHRFK